MSRTAKGTRAPGFEYWAARPFNKCGGIPNPFHKRRTHRAERQQGKREAREAIQ